MEHVHHVASRSRKRPSLEFEACANFALESRFFVLQKLGPTSYLIQEDDQQYMMNNSASVEAVPSADEEGTVVGDEDDDEETVEQEDHLHREEDEGDRNCATQQESSGRGELQDVDSAFDLLVGIGKETGPSATSLESSRSGIRAPTDRREDESVPLVCQLPSALLKRTPSEEALLGGSRVEALFCVSGEEDPASRMVVGGVSTSSTGGSSSASSSASSSSSLSSASCSSSSSSSFYHTELLETRTFPAATRGGLLTESRSGGPDEASARSSVVDGIIEKYEKAFAADSAVQEALSTCGGTAAREQDDPELPQKGGSSRSGSKKAERSTNYKPYSKVSDGAKKFKVSLGSPFHTCTCAKHQGGGAGGGGQATSWCVHICWIILKVLRVPREHPLAWMERLSDGDVQELCSVHEKEVAKKQLVELREKRKRLLKEALSDRKKRLAGGGVSGEGGEHGSSAADSGDTSANDSENKRTLTEDDVCPICHDELLDSEFALVECELGCKQPIHVPCMQRWVEHKVSNGDAVSCPLCRVAWTSDQITALKKLKARCDLKRARHVGVFCRKCKMRPIRGTLYACLVCCATPPPAAAGGSNKWPARAETNNNKRPLSFAARTPRTTAMDQGAGAQQGGTSSHLEFALNAVTACSVADSQAGGGSLSSHCFCAAGTSNIFSNLTTGNARRRHQKLANLQLLDAKQGGEEALVTFCEECFYDPQRGHSRLGHPFVKKEAVDCELVPVEDPLQKYKTADRSHVERFGLASTSTSSTATAAEHLVDQLIPSHSNVALTSMTSTTPAGLALNRFRQQSRREAMSALQEFLLANPGRSVADLPVSVVLGLGLAEEAGAGGQSWGHTSSTARSEDVDAVRSGQEQRRQQGPRRPVEMAASGDDEVLNTETAGVATTTFAFIEGESLFETVARAMRAFLPAVEELPAERGVFSCCFTMCDSESEEASSAFSGRCVYSSCKDDAADLVKLFRLPCGHVAHAECFSAAKRTTCPVCQTAVFRSLEVLAPRSVKEWRKKPKKEPKKQLEAEVQLDGKRLRSSGSNGCRGAGVEEQIQSLEMPNLRGVGVLPAGGGIATCGESTNTRQASMYLKAGPAKLRARRNSDAREVDGSALEGLLSVGGMLADPAHDSDNTSIAQPSTSGAKSLNVKNTEAAISSAASTACCASNDTHKDMDALELCLLGVGPRAEPGRNASEDGCEVGSGAPTNLSSSHQGAQRLRNNSINKPASTLLPLTTSGSHQKNSSSDAGDPKIISNLGSHLGRKTYFTSGGSSFEPKRAEQQPQEALLVLNSTSQISNGESESKSCTYTCFEREPSSSQNGSSRLAVRASGPNRADARAHQHGNTSCSEDAPRTACGGSQHAPDFSGLFLGKSSEMSQTAGQHNSSFSQCKSEKSPLKQKLARGKLPVIGSTLCNGTDVSASSISGPNHPKAAAFRSTIFGTSNTDSRSTQQVHDAIRATELGATSGLQLLSLEAMQASSQGAGTTVPPCSPPQAKQRPKRFAQVRSRFMEPKKRFDVPAEQEMDREDKLVERIKDKLVGGEVERADRPDAEPCVHGRDACLASCREDEELDLASSRTDIASKDDLVHREGSCGDVTSVVQEEEVTDYADDCWEATTTNSTTAALSETVDELSSQPESMFSGCSSSQQKNSSLFPNTPSNVIDNKGEELDTDMVGHHHEESGDVTDEILSVLAAAASSREPSRASSPARSYCEQHTVPHQKHRSRTRNRTRLPGFERPAQDKAGTEGLQPHVSALDAALALQRDPPAAPSSSAGVPTSVGAIRSQGQNSGSTRDRSTRGEPRRGGNHLQQLQNRISNGRGAAGGIDEMSEGGISNSTVAGSRGARRPIDTSTSGSEFLLVTPTHASSGTNTGSALGFAQMEEPFAKARAKPSGKLVRAMPKRKQSGSSAFTEPSIAASELAGLLEIGGSRI